MITGNTGTAQLPMKERAKNVYAEIVKRRGIRRHFIDKKVVDYLLKKEMVKIERHGTRHTSHSVVVPVDMPPIVDEEVREPYKKRKEAMAELKEKRKQPKKDAEEKLQEKIKETKEFYHYMKGRYYYTEAYPVSVERHAEYIIGIRNNKPYYAKKPANKKKKLKLTKSDLTFLRLQAK